ncbi:hypothetical protein BATDEDRAFT_19300 [Batrachochytrium dendrobatidis JAM81]|uniref:FTR1 family protein n=1 Tax=Batrachochytrium dendrobatidis (strain JAM81 / FGSC 10211) TaxID=684364 RepID=F4NZB9_BATDJ|nr:uncharacterized protein BATDEDRAFT_19300 [Batrachochytrium dendrobatidis JAM81]EGF81567.1 hypothetical protein BATDEDRAFT_19300 [Batrachochytrium dendrobatidis JAM81]|eukprot:XP_006677814.1 hypothetical protein BATDEDRAFT_19300 [Batrachochytrium dendrobatidis JAM81]
MPDLFSIPIFFILFRETIEAAIIISVLLALIDKVSASSTRFEAVSGKLKRQVWLGVLAGLVLSLVIGAVFLVFWYKYAINLWASAESLWEGIFGVIASIMVAITAIAMLKGSRMYEKYSVKLAKKLERQTETLRQPLKALFWLPFITMLREGLEAVVFVGGVSLSETPTSIPIAAIVGILLGIFIGFLLHTGGSQLTLHYFFVISACFLLLIANGLLAKAVGNFEDYTWSRAINLAADDVGTGAFDPRRSVWHFDCCNPEDKTQGWGIFNSVLGWRNNATIATVTIYCLFWVISSTFLIYMRLKETKTHQRKQQSIPGQSLSTAV